MSIFWFLISNPIGRALSITAVAAAIIGGAYTKGQYDGRRAVKAKIEAEKATAIQKGQKGAADALKKLDDNAIPDYWFRD